MISTAPARTVTAIPEDRVAGFARPELLATPEWLAENIGRPDLRVLDVRWRPDGSAATLYARRPHPGRASTSTGGPIVVDAAETRRRAPARRARPDGARRCRAPAIGDGTTVVVYDDTQCLFASRVWWSLRAYGFESARILDGGFPPGRRGPAGRATAQVQRRARPRSRRAARTASA